MNKEPLMVAIDELKTVFQSEEEQKVLTTLECVGQGRMLDCIIDRAEATYQLNFNKPMPQDLKVFRMWLNLMVKSGVMASWLAEFARAEMEEKEHV